MDRRKLVFALGSAWLSALVTSVSFVRRPSIYFKAEFSCDLESLGGAEAFFSLQRQTERTEDIKSLNHRYFVNGQLLDFKFIHGEKKLKWVYLFRDESSFQKWEQELYQRGLVSQYHQPYKIDRKLGYTLA